MNALWKVGEFRSSHTPSETLLRLSVGVNMGTDEKHHSFVRWVYEHAQEAGDVERQARTLLAIEYEREGIFGQAGEIRAGTEDVLLDEEIHLRAIVAALRSKQPAASEGDVARCPDCGDAVTPNPDKNNETRCADCFDTRLRTPAEAAVKFYVENPSAALFDFKARLKEPTTPDNTSKQAAGEAVAWQYRLRVRVGEPLGEWDEWSKWADCPRRKHDDYANGAKDDPTCQWDVRALYTTPPRHPADEVVARDAERYRWLRDHCQPDVKHRLQWYLPRRTALNASGLDSSIDAEIAALAGTP